jgi:hypothetical protein
MLLTSPLSLPILLLGLFYSFAGFVAVREVQKEALLDAALTGISGAPRDRLDQERSLWLYAGAAVVGAGGLLLLIGSALAAPPFLLSCLLQGLHFLVLSPRRYDRQEPVDPAGRRKSLNAFRIYALASVFVVWAALQGALKPPEDGSAWPLLLVGAVWLVLVLRGFVFLRGLTQGSRQT